jgi:fermentation-respiration switch protein FrsA (DUF1100 family)
MRAPLFILAALAALPFGHRAEAAAGPLAEVRLGLLWPDIGPPSTRLPGANVNAELLSVSPFAAWTSDLPAWLRWAAEPQVNLGGSVNTAGVAQQGYTGLTWTAKVATSLLHRDDALTFGFSIGPGWVGGTGAPRGLTSGTQLRLGAEIGYQVTPRFGLYVLFDHVASGSFSNETESLNELGVRVGLRF